MKRIADSNTQVLLSKYSFYLLSIGKGIDVYQIDCTFRTCIPDFISTLKNSYFHIMFSLVAEWRLAV